MDIEWREERDKFLVLEQSLRAKNAKLREALQYYADDFGVSDSVACRALEETHK